MLEYLRKKITHSPTRSISFYEYMNECLYHPELGYYMNAREKIGKQGDFYTTSYIHSVFAEVFVDVAVTIFKQLNEPFTFCEMGAGTGLFSKQFLDALQRNYPEIYQGSTYLIIEKSLYHRQKQLDLLSPHRDKVIWLEDLEHTGELGQEITYPKYKGILFSNELVDAFPVHLIEKKNGLLFEVGVTWNEKEYKLSEILHPLTNSEVQAYVEKEQLVLSDGQRLEIPLAAQEWVSGVANWMEEGIWLTIDYGYSHQELMSPLHRKGSLRCYRDHKWDENLLDQPGEKDITYHIHFDALCSKAEQLGWTKLGLARQDEFLLNAGILQFIEEHSGGDPFHHPVIKKNRAIHSLIAPDGISRAFQVLTLGKGRFLKQSYPFLQSFNMNDYLAKKSR